MESLHTILFVVQALVAVCLIGFILIQHGKGADAGAAFGSGASSTVFGSQGSSNFLTKVTAVLAIIFLGNSLFMAYLATQSVRQQSTSLMDAAPMVIEETMTTESFSEQMIKETEPLPSDLPAIPE